MTRIDLNGLCGSSPIGAMAAFGLLRVCSQISELGTVALSWKQTSDWHPILHVMHGVKNCEELAVRVVQFLCGRSQAEFLRMSDDIKMVPEVFRDKLTETQKTATGKSRDVADFLSAFGCDLITYKTKEGIKVKPTAFHLTAGNQSFLSAALRLATSIDADGEKPRKKRNLKLRANCEAAFVEALSGPWLYQDRKLHSLGWDPATEALGALTAIAPTDAGASCVRAAVWLAFESLPLFPCVPSGRKLETRCFALIDREFESFTWPIWDSAISLTTLQSLLAMDALNQNEPLPRELALRGIKTVYRSKCIRDDHNRGTLRHAVRCTMANGQ